MSVIKDSGDTSITLEKMIQLKNIYSNNKVIIRSIIKGNHIAATQIDGKFCICANYETPLEQNSWIKGTEIIKEFSYDFPLYHEYSFIQAIERLLKTPIIPSKRTNYLRMIILELERIQCHLKELGIIFEGLAYYYLSNKTLGLKAEITNILKHFNYNGEDKHFFIIGGIKSDISSEVKDEIHRTIYFIQKQIERLIRSIRRNRILKGIFKDVGFITRDTAIRLALVGPMARSTGISIDVRKSDPYLLYNDIEFTVPVSDYCDIYGELLVKCDEMYESTKIITQLINNLPPEEPVISDGKLMLGTNSAIIRTESPSGQLFYYIHSKEGDLNTNPRLVRLTSPIKINTQGILSRITGENLENIPYVLLTIGQGWRNHYQ